MVERTGIRHGIPLAGSWRATAVAAISGHLLAVLSARVSPLMPRTAHHRIGASLTLLYLFCLFRGDGSGRVRNDGHMNREGCADLLRTRDLDRALVFFHNPVGDGEPEPRPFTNRFRRKKRIKDARQYVWWNACSCIGDRDADRLLLH